MNSRQLTKFKECSHEKGHTLYIHVCSITQYCMITSGIVVFAEDEQRDREGSAEVTQTHGYTTTNPTVLREEDTSEREEEETVKTKVVSSHEDSGHDEGDTEFTAAQTTVPPLPQEELRMRRLKHLEQLVLHKYSLSVLLKTLPTHEWTCLCECPWCLYNISQPVLETGMWAGSQLIFLRIVHPILCCGRDEHLIFPIHSLGVTHL